MKNLLYILLFVPLALFGQEDDPCYSINEVFTQMDVENSSITKNFVGGWNMFGYPCSQEIDVVEAFSSIVDKVLIVKSNNGSVYMPEFGFNGIGLLEGGEGYQIKMANTEYGFSFCEHITWPNLEGCTDCEAVNFNQWANVDDGSCNYDSDGDGVPDFEEVVGCQDSMACDYDITATDEGECNYEEIGFDCDGNLLIYVGAEAEGGIVFYYDSIGDYGLVTATEDIGQFEWGCYGTSISGADGTAIGTGYQNTLDIVAVCSDTPTAASEAFAYESEGYGDWYLPSTEELVEMYNTIGNGGSQGNIGGFEISDWNYYWSSLEYSDNAAWVVNFNDGSIYSYDPQKNEEHLVRPIRAFGNWTMGCMDEVACNYNSEANMADGSCEYPQQGYDCNGNIIAQIGDVMEGGYLFYLDESGTRGLVSAMEDLGQFEWGCYEEYVDVADGTDIGIGYQNTLDIVNHGCSTDNGGITAAQACLDFESGEYSDWYLPSKDELVEMYNTIGNGGLQSNIGGFDTIYPYRKYWSSNELGYECSVFILSYAWSVNFYNGFTFPCLGISKNGSFSVRAVRSFGNWTMGCMDSLACNYNPGANMADGSCEFADEGYDCDGNITAEIGDIMEGGYLFYIDETGQHGLVAAMEDLEGTYEWGCYETALSGADGQSIGTGLQNTLDIVAGCSETPIAASEALTYVSEGYSDWYLPSRDELLEVYNTIGDGASQGNLVAFISGHYWSSSEYSNNWAWDVNFGDGGPNSNKNNPQNVRVIRSF